MGISLNFPFCISDIILFISNPVQSSINMLCIFLDGKKSPKLFVTGVDFSFSVDAKEFVQFICYITCRSTILSLLMKN